ncbi:thiol-disulfide isomerase/thioredoxin [Lutibacter oceani]|uniref:Thiol-disulfide isomerase/thioredoxin n=1 Tax=Lutibacter oceani TaxID=1853311 RepID=A0A3D9RSV1_9FLAO|nr:TlpA disulfide reductase family protein [Lutibacter oceani]REE83010.1 thiol-disulfide isomerase/thioredoxin [Lutibacter oceani]
MKKNIILILISVFLFSCKQEIPVDYVLLSGNISNTEGGDLNITTLNGFLKTITVKSDGSVSDTLYIEEDGLHTLIFEKNRISPFLSKGAKIHFNVDNSEFANTISFTGDNQELNNYFAYKAKTDFNFMENRKDTYNVDEHAFEKTVKDIAADYEEKLNAIANIPENIKASELRAINYGRLYKKESYERMHRYYAKIENFNASDDFMNEIVNMSYDNGDDFLYSSEYNQLIHRDISGKMYQYYSKDSLPYKEAQAKAFSEIKNEKIRNVEMYNDLVMTLARSEEKEKDLNDFLVLSTNETHKAKAKDLFEILKVLDPGQPSPTFENYENYAGGTSSLNDFKGKYVYIDVWATWCGPCKKEIPFLKKIEEQYHEKNIAFLSISVDQQTNKDKWKEMVADKELGGIQVIADKDFKSQFVADFKISGIPRFILLDPAGNIIKASAPRPSDEKLIELFDSLEL